MAIGEVKPRIVRRPDRTTYEVYQGEYRDRDGKRRFVTAKVDTIFSTPDKARKEALRLLRVAQNEVEAWERTRSGAPTLGQIIDEYIYDVEKAQRRGDLSNAMLLNENWGLAKVPDKLRKKKLSEFKDSGEIGELIKALRDDGYAIKTVKHVRDAISRVFTFAMNPPRSYVPRNVLRDYPIKLPKSPKRKNKAEKHEASLLIQMAFNRIGTGGQRLSKTPCCIASTSALASLASVSETSIGASPWPI
jgi:hypothetical protein